MTAEKIAFLAGQALREELETTPKPGLIDKNNSGSHSDMDFETMTKGIDAITPFFAEFFAKAMDGAKKGLSDEEIFSTLRFVGVQAEKAMNAQTGGVNTHKGAIFCFGNVIGAYGVCVGRGEKPTAQALCRTIKSFAAGVYPTECTELTAGERLFREYGIQGARGQAADGYAFVLFECLPLAEELLDKSGEEGKVKLLAFIMSELSDSNVFKRGGIEAVEYVRRTGAELYEHFSMDEADTLNGEFVKRNLSPGGAADTLALTLLLKKLDLIK